MGEQDEDEEEDDDNDDEGDEDDDDDAGEAVETRTRKASPQQLQEMLLKMKLNQRLIRSLPFRAHTFPGTGINCVPVGSCISHCPLDRLRVLTLRSVSSGCNPRSSRNIGTSLISAAIIADSIADPISQLDPEP